MDQRILEIIKKNSYLRRLVNRIPEEMLSFFLDKIQVDVSGQAGEIIHLEMEQNDEYINFVTPLEGIEIQEYYVGGMDKMSGQHAQAIAQENTAVIHYCNRGRAEINIKGEKYAYMQPGIMCIEWQQETGKNFNFYDETYGGLEIVFNFDCICNEDELVLKRLGVDLDALRAACKRNDEYYIGQCSDKLRGAFDNLVDIMKDRRKDKNTYLITMLYTLDLIRTEKVQTRDKQFYLTKGQRRIVRGIYDKCIHNLGKDISMSELEATYHVSSVSLNKYFEMVYGDTVKRYVQDARMKAASEKLVNSASSVADIALSVGYESQSKFGTVFKRKYGYTPLEYRRLYGGK